MNLFVLDTDILTLFQLSHPTVMARVAEHSPDQVAISVVTVEEQLSGWYAQLRKAKGPEKLAWAYRRLAANVQIPPDNGFPRRRHFSELGRYPGTLFGPRFC